MFYIFKNIYVKLLIPKLALFKGNMSKEFLKLERDLHNGLAKEVIGKIRVFKTNS